MEIVQEPHLYKTSWFLACCLLLLITAVWEFTSSGYASFEGGCRLS